MILNLKDYQSMLTANRNHNDNHTEHENILEKRIETLQKRILQLESEISLEIIILFGATSDIYT